MIVTLLVRYCHKSRSCYLIKVPLFLVQVGSQSISPLHINHQVLHLTLESLLGFLQRGTFGIHSLELLLSLLKTLGQLFPVDKFGLVSIRVMTLQTHLECIKYRSLVYV